MIGTHRRNGRQTPQHATTATHEVRGRTLLLALCLLVGLTTLTGCTNAEVEETPEAAAAEAGDDAASSTADGAAAAGTAEVIEVEMIDFGYVGLPSSVPAGTQLTVTNSSDEELHELVAFALPDDEERSVEDLTTLPPEELAAALGEPATVLLAEPGGPEIAAVGDGTLSEPGRYAIMCFIPTGVEPQVYLDAAAASEGGPPQVEGGPPHFVKGMNRELMVE